VIRWHQRNSIGLAALSRRVDPLEQLTPLARVGNAGVSQAKSFATAYKPVAWSCLSGYKLRERLRFRYVESLLVPLVFRASRGGILFNTRLVLSGAQRWDWP